MLLTKTAWVEKHGKIRRLFWEQFFTVNEAYMTFETTRPDLESLADWIIKNCQISKKTSRVLNPRAFCWHSGKNLFGKKATIVVCDIEGYRNRFYFAKGNYTLWLMMK